MGYDVTLHPVNRKEFKYFVEEVFDKPYFMDTKAAAIHNNEQERAYLIKSVYSNFPKFKEQLNAKSSSFEKTIGFAATAILGYLQPFWYLRNGLISNLLSIPKFKEVTSNLSSIVKEDNKVFFDSENGIEENYSSGVFIQNQNIPKLLEILKNTEFKNLVIEAIGEENLNPLLCCLEYCDINKLDLLESSDLCTPFSGEFYTLPSNMKALHLKNTSEYSNLSRKKIPLDYGNSITPAEINIEWWKNLNDEWRDSLKNTYQAVVTPRFNGNYSERNLHVETKFNSETINLDGIDDLEEVSIGIVNRDNNFSTITPFFDFHHLKNMNISSYLPTEFDLRRILQFPHIEQLGINQNALKKGFTATNFSSLKELKKLRHLKLGETELKAADLKEIKNFSNLVSLSLLFAPYRSVSFLKGNKYLEALALSYTKGLANLPNLKRLHLFPKEKNPVIENCPNIELINCYGSKRMIDLSSFVHLANLKTLVIRSPYKSIDLALLNEMSSVKSFYVDNKTNLDSILKPIDFIKEILVSKDLDEKIIALATNKFPNGEIIKFKSIPYQ